jgi:tetratricopeptide (TPR) repeat protein
LFGGRDHEDVVTTLNDLAIVLERSGAVREAIARLEQALAMATRLSSDHPSLATVRHNLGSTLDGLGRSQEARPHLEEALAMRRRLYGRHDHPRLVSSMVALASCLRSIGQATEALALAREACDQVDGLRHGSRVSAELRQALFDDLKRDGAFELLQRLACAGDPMLAFAAAERSRGRGLLDLLEQQRADPLHEAERRAAMRGDEAGAAKLRRLRADLAAAEVEGDRRLHALARLVDSRLPDAERQVQRRTLLAESDAVNQHRRQLLDERARLLADVLPVGRVRTAAEIQAALRIGEVLLEFTLTRDLALLYVVPRDGAVDVIELPQAFATVQRVVPALLQRSSHPNLRGRDPGGKDGAAAEATDAASRELFASLIPASAWERVRSAKHVFVAAHRELHRLPFELLVVDQKAGKAVHWLDAGPPISYLPSGSALHWLRQRSKEASDDSTSLDLLAVGDPRRLDAEPPVPEQGVFVVAVDEGGEGARVGLQPGDVLVGYDGKPLADDKALRDARMAVERAVEDKERDTSPIPIGVWRRGTRLTVEARPGPLGIQVGRGRARAAWEASRGGDAQLERITRAGDLERIGQLSPLRGARAETEAIEKVFADRKAQAKRLLGAEATEPAVFDLAPKAKYLHFACHGIAEEYAGQSLSMLVLSQPDRVLPGDDGLLQLADLWNSWRGRLASCRLVVLSACQTNVGPTQRDEAPQALPLGFLFAGAPAVISTLWPVDDASTKELMADFYARLLAGETDQLVAFTAAKKALRQKYPDPFHWAPFLYLGAPE